MYGLIISGLALLVSFSTLIIVFIQLKSYTNQLKLDSLIHISSINRDLLTLGFSDGDFFLILEGNKKCINSRKKKRYLQLWLNQIDIIWHAQKMNLIIKEDIDALRVDITDLLILPDMQAHWNTVKQYYANEFREFIDNIITECLHNKKNAHFND